MICCRDKKDKTPKDPYINRNLDPELIAILENMPSVSWWPIIVMVLGVIFVWGTIGFLPWGFQYGSWPWCLSLGLGADKAAEFGDSFGFVNSLISSLALVGVIAAIWLQKQELMEQRKEMMITQWELKKSTDAQKESADSQKASADLQRQTKEELAKQARINLQSTILAALDGIAKAAENERLYPSDEGAAAVAFVNEMRYVVIADILGNRETEESSPLLLGSLETWRNLSSQIAICNEIDFKIDRLWKRARRSPDSVAKGKLSNDDFPATDRQAFKAFVLEKARSLSSPAGEEGDNGIASKLETSAESIDDDTINSLKSITGIVHQHRLACRKIRNNLFAVNPEGESE
ncbi:MAG: hypothetical protein ACE37I_00105 [Rubinisphaera brasiliensis]|uniref:hypothetical protein n=1 Tax=Rubinisphaera brasiliensis TaxID=119 RepID=UPI00391CBBC2